MIWNGMEEDFSIFHTGNFFHSISIPTQNLQLHFSFHIKIFFHIFFHTSILKNFYGVSNAAYILHLCICIIKNFTNILKLGDVVTKLMQLKHITDGAWRHSPKPPKAMAVWESRAKPPAAGWIFIILWKKIYLFPNCAAEDFSLNAQTF